MTNSHKVQSVRAVVEQTIADLKVSKVMEWNKINSVAAFEEVLDCVIGLHNLRVLLKLNPRFDIPARRAAIQDEHIFKPRIPAKDVDLKIPADSPDLSLEKYRHIREFKEFLPSGAGAIRKALELHGNHAIFFSNSTKTWAEPLQRCIRSSVEDTERTSGIMDGEVYCWSLIQL